MERVNKKGGLAPLPRIETVPLLTPTAFEEQTRNQVIIDTREPEGYAGGHVAKSHSIWLGGLPVFGGWVTDEKTPVFLITDRNEDVALAAKQLARIGIDNVDGALAGGFGSWRSSGNPIAAAGTITPETLHNNAYDYQVLDVREDDEFAGGHIPGATHMYVGYLEERLKELSLDKDRPVVVTCGVGHRAGLGVSILLRAGFTDVRNLLGGMKAWHGLELPVEP